MILGFEFEIVAFERWRITTNQRGTVERLIQDCLQWLWFVRTFWAMVGIVRFWPALTRALMPAMRWKVLTAWSTNQATTLAVG